MWTVQFQGPKSEDGKGEEVGKAGKQSRRYITHWPLLAEAQRHTARPPAGVFSATRSVSGYMVYAETTSGKYTEEGRSLFPLGSFLLLALVGPHKAFNPVQF